MRQQLRLAFGQLSRLVLLLILVQLAVGLALSSFQSETFTLETQTDSIYTINNAITIGSPTINLAPSSPSNLGTTPATAVEMTSTGGTARINIVYNQYRYNVRVSESSVNSVTDGTYKVELFKDESGEGVPTLVGTLYIKQATPETGSIEYNSCRFGLGTSSPPSSNTVFTVRVTRV